MSEQDEPLVGDEPAGSTTPNETERLVSCYLDATIPGDRRDEIQDAVRERLARRRGGSRAQVLALVHEVVEDRVDIAPIDAGVALIRECGLTPLGASLIVGLNRDELQAAVTPDADDPPAIEAGDAAPPPTTELDDDALAVLSGEVDAPPPDDAGDHVGSATDDPAPAPGPEPVPIALPGPLIDHYETWSDNGEEPPGRAIPAVAAVVALLVVAAAVVAILLTGGGGGDEETAGPADDVPADAPAAADDAPAGTADDGPDGGGDEPQADVPGDDAGPGTVDVVAAGGGEPQVGRPVVASFTVPAARDDLRWTLASSGRELFAPTPLVVPPGATGTVRLLIPTSFLSEPGTYLLRVVAGGETVVEHEFSVADA